MKQTTNLSNCFRSLVFIINLIPVLLGNDTLKSREEPSFIPNASFVNVTDIPFMISIRNGDFYFCGGSLISLNWVLSAAHCMVERSNKFRDLNNIRLVAGASSLADKPPRNKYDVQIRFCIECRMPDYNSDFLANDIALLKSHRPFILSRFVQLINLPRTQMKILRIFSRRTNDRCWEIGFTEMRKYEKGHWDTIPKTAHLKRIEVQIIPEDICQSFYPNMNLKHVICTKKIKNPNLSRSKFESGFDDICAGDSGGPLICPSTFGVYEQVGVISEGPYCGSLILPSLHARVDYHHNYLEKNLESGSVYIGCSVLICIGVSILWIRL